MNVKQLKEKYQDNAIEDFGCIMSPSAKKFAMDFKNTLKSILKPYGCEVASFNVGHYYFSGFIKKEDKCLYFSREIERYDMPINLNRNFLIRKAKGVNDFRGERNEYCTLEEFERLATKLLEI